MVVLGWGTLRENILIQCKATWRDELNSEMAVREAEGAQSYYENAMGVSFGKRCLHTTARRLSKRTLHAAKICGVTVPRLKIDPCLPASYVKKKRNMSPLSNTGKGTQLIALGFPSGPRCFSPKVSAPSYIFGYNHITSASTKLMEDIVFEELKGS